MHIARLAARTLALTLLLLAGQSAAASAQDIPTTLTDKVYQGNGTIDLLKDVSATGLDQYLDANGRLMFAIDVNENASGNESSSSQGIALKQMTLVITTTAGTFTFSDFYTSTSASLVAAGSSVAQDYYTVFGQGGSSTINGGTSSFDPSGFDDVIYMDHIAFTGTILSASLQVSFLDTANTGKNTNETFFDYSGGFEDFALIDPATANALEAANYGVADAPATVSYSTSPVAPAQPAPQPIGSGAPAPPLALLAGLAVAVLWKARTA